MIERTIVTEFPPAALHLNYRGNCTGSVGRVMGPMLPSDGIPAGQYLTVVDEHYDLAKDRTRLGLVYGALDLEDDSDDGTHMFQPQPANRRRCVCGELESAAVHLSGTKVDGR